MIGSLKFAVSAVADPDYNDPLDRDIPAGYPLEISVFDACRLAAYLLQVGPREEAVRLLVHLAANRREWLGWVLEKGVEFGDEGLDGEEGYGGGGDESGAADEAGGGVRGH